MTMPWKVFDKDQVGKEARNAIRGQRHRCNNPKAVDYKYYGGKGIKVIYETKEFYEWFKIQRAKIPLHIKVNVDRLDHSKHYTLENVRLIPKVDNVIESNIRRAKVTIEQILEYRGKGYSQKEIADVFGVQQVNISYRLKCAGIVWGKRVSRPRTKR